MPPIWPSRSATDHCGHEGTGASAPARSAAVARSAPFERIASTYSSYFTVRPASTRAYRRAFEEIRAVVGRLVDEHGNGPRFELLGRSGNQQRLELVDVVVLHVEPHVPRRLRQDHRHAM